MEHLKDTVRDYLPGREKETHHNPMHMLDKSHMLSFVGLPTMAIIIALIIVLLSAFIFMRRRQGMKPLRRAMEWIQMKRRGTSTVLLCGPVDSGKTALFHTLSGGNFQQTQTSMEENVDTFKIHPKILGDKKDKLCDINFEFIDFPGHPSQEAHLGKFYNRAQGIILMVDASSNDSINHGAKTLYSLLEKKGGGFLGKKAPVLICANKIDMNDSLSLNAVRARILEEMNKLKDSRSGSEKREQDVTSVGKSGEKLTWDNLGATVSFGQISAKQGKITDVLDFLEGIQCC
jgi:small GTP-binding protein